jgi:exosortase/archaeosortase
MNDEALLRRGRDLSLVRELVDRLDEVTRRLEACDSAAATPDADAASCKRAPSQPSGHDKAVALAVRVAGRLPTIAPATAVLLGLIALLAAHFLIIIHYDLPLIWLRLASIVLPCAFGFFYRQKTDESLLAGLVVGVILAAVAILAMSAVVGKVDSVPILPTDAHGWGEVAQYGASIAFAFFTGTVIRQIVIVMHDPTVRTSELAHLAAHYARAKISGAAPGDPNDPRRDRHLKRIGMAERVITACTAIGSAVVSIWSGLAFLS